MHLHPNSSHILRCSLFLLFAAAAFLALPLVATAQTGIVANFDDGNTTFSPDGFEGSVGNGWTSAWVWDGSGQSGVATVLDTNPINGGGNYLSVESPGGGNREVTLGREFAGAFGSFDPTRYHVVSFDLRFDDTSAFDMPDSATWVRLLNADNLRPNNITHTWWAGINSTATGAAGEWIFRDGSGNDTGVSIVLTGIGLQEGVTYSFTFEVFPETSQYTASLATSDNESFQSDLLFFRGERFDPEAPNQVLTRAGANLIFNTQKANNEIIMAEDFTYSLDNVSIIPEPGSVALMIGVLSFALCVCLRRRTRA